MNMKNSVVSNIIPTTDELRCDHCHRVFVRASSFERHICEQKRRWMDRDRPSNRIAYNAWIKFYKIIQPSKRTTEYKDYVNSAYYVGFLKFGTYCVDIGVINPIAYVEWLLKEQIPLDNWNSDRQYTRYLVMYARNENALEAVHRSIETMLKLSEEQNIQLSDVFKYISPTKLCFMITAGKISPWILYHSKTGKQWLSILNDDQRGFIYEYIDPERWQIKFKRSPEDVKTVIDIISEIPGL